MTGANDSGPPFAARLAGALSWRRWAWTGALAAFLPLSGIYLTVFDWTVARFVSLVPWHLAFGAITLAWVAIAEATARSAPVSSKRYIGAVVAAALACGAIGWAFPEALRNAMDPPKSNVATRAPGSPPANVRLGFFLIASLNVTFYGLLVVLTYSRLQRVRLAARALSDAEVAREEAQGRIAASRLEAARGAIDPTAVIARLEEIERAYDTDAAGAEAMLDELIARLRASIPRMRTGRASPAAP
ncbi:MAG: hypothetical protein ACXWG1_09320 [Usitatibacter sp.]